MFWLQTVPASQATDYAKPIPKQKTDKGFVALLFAGGAASIFGAAVLLEKNSRLFPAIHKANQVMREAELRSKVSICPVCYLPITHAYKPASCLILRGLVC